MIRIFVTVIFSVGLVISAVNSGWCQKAPAKMAPSPKEQVPQAPEGKQTVGEVAKIDQKSKMMTLKTKEGEKKFDVSAAAVAGYGSVADIKPGDKVAVLFNEKDGKLAAKAIANHAAMMKMHQPAK